MLPGANELFASRVRVYSHFAAVIKVSPDTVMCHWRLARAWLLAELSGTSPFDARRPVMLKHPAERRPPIALSTIDKVREHAG